MAFMQNVVQKVYPRPPISDSLGFEFIEVAPGRSRLTFLPEARWYNLIETVHGGIAATLLDTAMATAILTQLPAGRGFTTLELKLNYIRAMTAETGEVQAEGSAIHVGRTTATAEGRLLDARGRLLAHGTTTCLIVDL